MEHQSLLLERCDPDQLLNVIDGTDFRHQVLPGGSPCVRTEKLRLQWGVLQRGWYGMRVIADGAMPQGLISVGFITGNAPSTSINGVFCRPYSVQLYAEGADVHYHAAPENSWVAYCVERERLQQAALSLLGQPLPIPDSNAISVQPDEAGGRRLAATVEALFALATYPEPEASILALSQQLEEQLQYDIARAVIHSSSRHCHREAARVAQRRRIMQHAEDYLRANLLEHFSLGDLARATGTSHRMLQYHFRSIYGVTPQQWFRSMKLNAIRRELKRSRGTGLRVSDVAVRCGFLHFGRFSQEYRRLFREHPSETLRP